MNSTYLLFLSMDIIGKVTRYGTTLGNISLILGEIVGVIDVSRV